MILFTLKNRASRYALALMALLAGIAPVFAFARPVPAGYTSVNQFLTLTLNITEFLFALFIGFAILMLLWAAFSYLTAAGDEERVGKAKKTIIGAVIALVIAFLANGVPVLVQVFLNV